MPPEQIIMMEPANTSGSAATFHYRRSAFSLAEVESLLASPIDTRLTELLRTLSEVKSKMNRDGRALGREWTQILDWAQKPDSLRLPSSKSLKSAQKKLGEVPLEEHRDYERLLSAVVDTVRLIRAPVSTTPAEERERLLALFERLRDSKFLSMLAWSQPDLAASLFTGQASELASRRNHSLRQAAQTCIGYLLGSIGRLAPRDAWIEVGFGSFGPLSSPSLSSPRIWIDPDLSWFSEGIFKKLESPSAGLSAWDFLLERAIPTLKDPKTRIELTRCLHQLKVDAQALSANRTFPCLASILEFQGKTRKALSPFVDAAFFQRRPNPWWISFTDPEDVSLSADGWTFLNELRRKTECRWEKNGLITRMRSESVQSQGPRIPAILRRAQDHPASIVASGEELWDWTLTEESAQTDPFWYPVDHDHESGLVFSGRGDSLAFHAIDPSPDRSAERFAVERSPVPAFFRNPSKKRLVRLAPPRSLVDNRMLRLALGPEVEVSEARPGSELVWPSTLNAPAIADRLALEFASPRYQKAPEIIPGTIAVTLGEPLSVGTLFTKEATWILKEEDRDAYSAEILNPQMFHHFYQMEIAASLGWPKWLSCQLDGKKVLLPTSSCLAWTWLFHETSHSQGPVLIQALSEGEHPSCETLSRWAAGRPWMILAKPCPRP